MDERRSPSAVDAEAARQVRVRLLSPWAMLGIAVAVCGVLYLLFPKQSLLEQVRAEHGNDALTAGYLAALLRT